MLDTIKKKKEEEEVGPSVHFSSILSWEKANFIGSSSIKLPVTQIQKKKKKFEKELARYRTEKWSNSAVFVLEQVRHMQSTIRWSRV